MKRSRIIILIIAISGWLVWQNQALDSLPGLSGNSSSSSLQQAINERQSDAEVEGSGRVVRVLPDDNEGSRHQRFILDVGRGQTILIAHNIDLAPRISNLRKGDEVAFKGEFEWNDRGGVVHWTHLDPQHRHVGGWLKHAGRTYQ